MAHSPSVYLIAGELSGDKLGGKLMQALQEHPDFSAMQYKGIGGMKMMEQGLTSLFPMQELSLMGFVEVLPHIRRLKKRIRETVEAIEQINPAVVITIDSPGFCFRVVKMLRDRGHVRPLFVHYVAPSVWAYKPERAEKTAKLFDMLWTLLPFEPAYFESHGLHTVFVGHPIVDDGLQGIECAEAWRNEQQIAKNARIITMFVGSRQGEVKRHLPVFKAVAEALQQYDPALHIVLPVPVHLEAHIKSQVTAWSVPILVVSKEEDKWAATKASDVALVKSGTIALEVAMCGTPMVTAYKAHPVTAWMVGRMLQTPYVNLINILNQKMVIPELLQKACCAKELVPALQTLLTNREAREAQQQAMRTALDKLYANKGKSASVIATQALAEMLKNKIN